MAVATMTDPTHLACTDQLEMFLLSRISNQHGVYRNKGGQTRDCKNNDKKETW